MRLRDFGPIYAETDLSRFPVEPWNTASNLIFLILIIHFARLTRLDFKRHPLIVFSLPILFIGFIGGTVFHATRSDRIWLVMDYMPIMILSLLAAMALIKRLTGSWIRAFLIGAVFFAAIRVIFSYSVAPMGLRIAVGYSSLAVMILGPALLVSKREKWRDVRLLLGAVVLFSLAIACRTLDRDRLLPMGTHFMWHIFGGLSVYCLMTFLFRLPPLLPAFLKGSKG